MSLYYTITWNDGKVSKQKQSVATYTNQKLKQ